MSNSRYSQLPGSMRRSMSSASGAYPPSPGSGSPASSHRRAPSIAQRAEMDAAFDDDADEDDEEEVGEDVPLSRGRRDMDSSSNEEALELGTLSNPASRHQFNPGAGIMNDIPTDAAPSYDFERDYFLPPSSSPPPGAYISQPTPLTTTPRYPSQRPAAAQFIRSILPTYFTNRGPSAAATQGTDGVWANLSAKPDNSNGGEEVDGENGVMHEYAQKEGPPSYNTALRDAVPPYWENSVVLNQSPFGVLGGASGNGDEILVDGMPVGNFFGFAWNLLVSLTFQFVGFLLTYVLHSTHSAKYGSRAGLGITLIQYGLYLRQRAESLIENGFPDAPAASASATDGVLGTFWNLGSAEDVATAITTRVAAAATATATAAVAATLDTSNPSLAPMWGTSEEQDAWFKAHNMTNPLMPTAEEIGRANEWFSFALMSLGWFVLLTSLAGYWRVHKYERSLAATHGSGATGRHAPRPADWHPSTSESADDDNEEGDANGQRGMGLRVMMNRIRDAVNRERTAWQTARERVGEPDV